MRFNRVSSLLRLILLCALLAPSHAQATRPVGTTETMVRPDGQTLVRSITSDPSDLLPTPSGPGTPGRLTRDTALWIDRNHMNAVAENVAITGDDQYGIVGWWLNNKRCSLYAVPGGTGTPNWTHWMPAAAFQIPVDADDAGIRLMATARGESLFTFTAATPDPIYSDWYSGAYVGYRCGVSDAGNTYAGGGGDPSGTGGEVRVHSGATGALRFVKPLTAPPEGICVSPDGNFVASNVRAYAKVWDAMTGAMRDSVPIAGETQTPAVLSGDGTYLVTGGFYKTVKLYHWDGAHYVLDWSHNIPGTTWVTALAISEDGRTIVAGTWTNPTGGKVVVYDKSSATPLWTDSSFGDEVPSVAVTPDGGIIAAASWGRQGGTVGNVISVYDRSSATPTHTIADDAISGVGSVMSIDLSHDGRYLLAGGKAVHARDFGNGGFVLAMQMTNPADAPESASLPRRIEVGPNPFTTSMWIRSAGAVRIFSADGRSIRLLTGSRWDGRDGAGREVPPGVYFLRGDRSAEQPVRVVRLR